MNGRNALEVALVCLGSSELPWDSWRALGIIGMSSCDQVGAA